MHHSHSTYRQAALQDIVVAGSINRVAAAVAECVNLERAKSYLHVGYTEDDDLILSLITAAREWVEERTSRALIKQAIKCRVELYQSMEIPFGPIYPATIPIITPTMGSINIIVGPGPFPRLEGVGTYDLEYTSGEDAGQVPEALKLAIMARVAATYENRGDQDKTNFSQVAFDYLQSYKRIISWL